MLPADAVPVEETNLPRYTRFRGKRVRVVAYSPKTERRSARFHIIDHRDAYRSVSREDLTFVKEKSRA